MKKVETFFILRDGKYIWLAPGLTMLTTDELLEKRPMIIADDGKTLIDKNGNNIGKSFWNKNNIEIQEINDIPGKEIKNN